MSPSETEGGGVRTPRTHTLLFDSEVIVASDTRSNAKPHSSAESEKACTSAAERYGGNKVTSLHDKCSRNQASEKETEQTRRSDKSNKHSNEGSNVNTHRSNCDTATASVDTGVRDGTIQHTSKDLCSKRYAFTQQYGGEYI